jgi:sulfate permease, SulP family
VLVLRRVTPRAPAPLIAVGLATVFVAVFHLDTSGVAILGHIPSGLPRLGVPSVSPGDLGPLAASAFGIMLLTFSDTILNARSFAARAHTTVDANQELVALGAAQLAAGLSHGFPISASGTRTAINVSVGGKTQLTSIIAALALVLMLLVFTGPLAWFPHAALGAVLVAAMLGLMDIRVYVTLYRVRKQEFAIALTTLIGVLALGLLYGILLAVLLSFVLLLRRVVRPHDAILGRVEGLDSFHDVEDFPASETIPGLIVYRFDAPLFFANASYLKSRVLMVLEEADSPVAWFLLDAEAITDLDVTASDALSDLCALFAERHITFAMARAKSSLRTMLARTHLTEKIGEDHFFPSIRVAVEAFLASHDDEKPL